jgi:hypothetical protein
MPTYSPTIDELTVLAKHWASRRIRSQFHAYANNKAAGADFDLAQDHLDGLERSLGSVALAQVVAAAQADLRAEVGEVVWPMFQKHLKQQAQTKDEPKPSTPETPSRDDQPDWNELRRRFEGPYYDACE